MALQGLENYEPKELPDVIYKHLTSVYALADTLKSGISPYECDPFPISEFKERMRSHYAELDWFELNYIYNILIRRSDFNEVVKDCNHSSKPTKRFSFVNKFSKKSSSKAVCS